MSIAERARELAKLAYWKAFEFAEHPANGVLEIADLIEQALLAERRLAMDSCIETVERMRDGAQQRSDDLTSFSPGHDRWAAAQLDILAQALRAAAEKEV